MQEIFKVFSEEFKKTIKQTMNIDLNYDESSIYKLDEIIELIFPREEKKLFEDTVGGPIDYIGSYLGETLRILFNGEWVDVGGDWAVKIKNADAMPFIKTKKRILNGEEDSITYFYQLIKNGIDNDFTFRSDS